MGDIKTPPKVKLLTLWMFDAHLETPAREPNDHFISHGIWETRSAFFKDDRRAYELVCRMPMHPKLQVGDTRRMYEDVILGLCHQVVIQSLPKQE